MKVLLAGLMGEKSIKMALDLLPPVYEVDKKYVDIKKWDSMVEKLQQSSYKGAIIFYETGWMQPEEVVDWNVRNLSIIEFMNEYIQLVGTCTAQHRRNKKREDLVLGDLSFFQST